MGLTLGYLHTAWCVHHTHTWYALISFCAFPINSIKTKANEDTPTLLEGSRLGVVTQW